MVIVGLGSRYRVKKALKKAYEYIEKEDWSEALTAKHRLQDEIRRYLLSQGKNFDEFDDLLHELYFNIRVSSGLYKKKVVLITLNKITKALEEVPENPKEKLSEMYKEIRSLFFDLNKENAFCLVECFEEIRDLEKEFKKIGGPSYDYYPALLQSIAKVEPILMRVAEKDKPSSSLTSELSDKVGKLFMSIMKVQAPPIKIPIDRKTILYHLGRGVSMEDIAIASGRSQEEITEILEGEKSEKSGET